MISESAFIDTSAFYALMDLSDKHHEEASRLWKSSLEKNIYFYTSNYIIIETLALLQNRLGFEAADIWYRDVLGIVEVLWIDNSHHNFAFELWLSLGRRKLSLVDCVSFATMRHHKIEKVSGFDKHFKEQGFEIIDARSY